jgi:hypothetical protein
MKKISDGLAFSRCIDRFDMGYGTNFSSSTLVYLFQSLATNGTISRLDLPYIDGPVNDTEGQIILNAVKQNPCFLEITFRRPSDLPGNLTQIINTVVQNRTACVRDSQCKAQDFCSLPSPFIVSSGGNNDLCYILIGAVGGGLFLVNLLLCLLCRRKGEKSEYLSIGEKR